MEPIARHLRNPFGIQPPCEPVEGAEPVPGYGRPEADFHLIGNHAGVHGGAKTGIPFTDHPAGRAVLEVFETIGLLDRANDGRPVGRELFMSYVHMCPVAEGAEPTDAAYRDLHRFFDAELRAVNAHILVPVGARATDRILAGYTTQFRKLPVDMDWRHARDIRGRGFLVVPMKDPSDWQGDDRDRIIARLRKIRNSDYRQTKGVATMIG